MIDVRRLRALRELADRGTIAAAADALRLTPSAVSQQLAALEADIGQALIERDGRGVRLTGAAQVVLRHADAMLVEVERLAADLDGLRSAGQAVVRVGAFSTAISGLVVPALAALGPEGPELRVLDAEAPEVFDLLRRHELDVAIAMESQHAPRDDDPRVWRTALMADTLDAAVPAGHPLAEGGELALADLSAEPWIVPPEGWSCEHVVSAGCAAAGFRPDVRHRTHDWTAVLDLVGAGLGVSLVPRLASAQPPRSVAVLPLSGEPPARYLFAACRRGTEEQPAIARVLDALAAAATARRAPALTRRTAPP